MKEEEEEKKKRERRIEINKGKGGKMRGTEEGDLRGRES